MKKEVLNKLNPFKKFNTKRKNSILSIFLEKNCLFFHIPKTAGISVSKSLFGDVEWGHRGVSFYKSYYGEDTFNTLYKFCFVRNPYKRLFSAYTFLKQGGINNQDLEFSKSYLKEYINFNEFVLKGLEKKEIMNWVHFKPQYTFICDENDKVVMDFIGKVENLNTDFNTVCKQLNIKSELQTLNKSKIIKNEFSEEIKNIIKLKYQKDFNLFYPDL
ncbi:MAG: hypothetical protein CMP55_02330 [Flavobacteriales bacterium]|nr:hypothetical protein [Flavobacteriales bacterium]|tara:strand:+ start:1486 stop:2133 length:648 start_codon:yes stop_codon:yes gene_type:complete